MVMRATLLFSLLLGIASTHTAGQRATRSPIGQDLRSSDFGRAFAEQNLRGYIQVADSKIFVFDSSAPRILAYGPEGQFLGSLRLPAPRRLARHAPSWYGKGRRDHLVVDGEQVYVSWRGRIVRWDVGLLDPSFRLVFRRDLLDDPTFAASPRVFDIDTENRRLLVFNGQDDHPQFRFVSVAPTP